MRSLPKRGAIMAKRKLPSLSDLSDDADARYGELEEHVRRLERRIERRTASIDDSVRLLRDAEEAILAQEGIEYDYFSHDDMPEPKKGPDYVVETLAGVVCLYDLDEAGFDLISMRMQEALGDEHDRIAEEFDDLQEVGHRYAEFMDDLAVRYATVIVVGEEDIDDRFAAVYCVGKEGKAMFVQADAHQESVLVVGEEDGTIEDYLSEKKQQEIAGKHAACDHTTYIITHPSEIFSHENLAIAAGSILQERYFKSCPKARAEHETQERIVQAQGLGMIFGAVNQATKDPLGIGSDDSDDKPN